MKRSFDFKALYFDLDDDLLGDDWTWSDRHWKQVNSPNCQLWVSDHGRLMFKIDSGIGHMRISEKDTKYPVIKLILITRDKQAVRAIAERYKEVM